ncbi:hypothetical protein KIN20_029677 [Parelaphostrongylus tenuis]|uniref:Uncharacterized protein n=1 Tax=Parelaphostrongylus tenuis TaxID=148309 RepID=A0AAD5R2T4_PARTN|nr:hypothetical protein KIN20_029677 [Parelaphostrongylus tenuis]
MHRYHEIKRRLPFRSPKRKFGQLHMWFRCGSCCYVLHKSDLGNKDKNRDEKNRQEVDRTYCTARMK